MRIRYAGGLMLNAMLLSVEGSRIGAAISGVDESIEFTLVGNEWMTDSGLVVSFEFHADREPESPALVTLAPDEACCAAGGGCLLRRWCPGATN